MHLDIYPVVKSILVDPMDDDDERPGSILDDRDFSVRK